jgi:hypothetical protein
MACLGSLCSAISQIHDLSPFQIASMDSLAVEMRARYARLVAEGVEGVEGVEGTGMVYSTFSDALKSLLSPTGRTGHLLMPLHDQRQGIFK